MAVQNFPERGTFNDLTPFRFWCQKVLPLVYDDSLSYYEVLCKVIDYLNKTMEDVDTLNDDMQNLYDFAEHYFDNLDVQTEINNKLDKMAADGTLDAIMAPRIASDVSEWLTENITTPETVVIDSSLSVDGAVADAAAAGKYIFEYRALTGYNILDDYTKDDRETNGIDFDWVDSNICHVTGTATDTAFVNIIESTDAMPAGISVGSRVFYGILNKHGNITSGVSIRVYSCDSNDVLTYIGHTSDHSVIVIPTGSVSVLVRIEVANGTAVSGDFLPYFSVVQPAAVRGMAQDKSCWLYPISGVNFGPIITTMSSYFKCVHLARGEYTISSAIDLSAGTALIGESTAMTILKPASNVVTLGIRGGCYVKGISFDGGEASAPSTEGTQIGIYINEVTGYFSIEDCQFIGYTRYGIFANDCGGGSLNQTIRNCMFWHNYVGARIANSEYIVFSDCSIYQNYYGVYDSAGNTVYNACGFNGNGYGLYNHGGIEANHAHGIISCCQFNHNSFEALHFENCDNGEIVSGCQFHFATINLSGARTQGINFIGCQFGNASHISILKDSTGYVRMHDCMFDNTPTITVTAGTLAFVDCWKLNGDPMTGA